MGWAVLRPTKAAEIVSVSDVIRVRLEDGAWSLVQLPEVQGAIVAIDPRTGRITAMVGGYDFDISEYNHATQAQRQPGSGLNRSCIQQHLLLGLRQRRFSWTVLSFMTTKA